MADLTVTAAQVSPVFEKYESLDMIAAEAITKGQAVYQTSAGKAGVADADAAGKQQFRGIALNSAAAGQAVTVLRDGPVYGFTLSGVAYDGLVYLSDTAGKLGDAAGTMTVVVGRVYALPDNALTKVLWINVKDDGNWS